MTLQEAQDLVAHHEKLKKMKEDLDEYLSTLKTRGKFSDDYTELNEIQRQFRRVVERHVYGRSFGG